jgi:hypothetical protein
MDIKNDLKTQLAEVEKYLPRRYAKRVSERLSTKLQRTFEEGHIRNVCKGHAYNRDIIIELIEFAKEEQSRIEKALNA